MNSTYCLSPVPQFARLQRQKRKGLSHPILCTDYFYIISYNPSDICACAWQHMTEYVSIKTGEYPRDIPQFSTLHMLWQISEGWQTHIITSIWHKNMLGCSQKTVHFSEQIMSEDKCPSLCLQQMEAIVYLYMYPILHIFAHVFPV